MSTNKVVLKSVDQERADFKPIYQPFFANFLGSAKAYPAEVGKLNFKRLEAVGDIRNKHVTPKDTEMHQISIKEGSKTFKKYFLASQMVQSSLQDQSRTSDVINQVVDEQNKQMDDLFLLGEGSSASTMINNGLFWSNDPNYRLENSIELDKGTAEDHLKDMHTKIMVSAAIVNEIAGSKMLVIYGSTACAKYDSLYANTDAPFKKVLAEVLGSEWKVVKLPAACTPSNTNGWIAVNMDQIQVHYTVLPGLYDQGVNAEEMHSWHNFLMGSCMVEVLVDDAIVRQPVTFEA